MGARSHLNRFLPIYITHRNYVNKGNGEITTLRQIVQVILIAKVAFAEAPIWALILMGITALVIYWSVGYLWDKTKGYEFEAEWSNTRNPTIQLIKRKI